MKSIVFLLSLLVSLVTTAQDSIYLGTSHTLHSAILKEPRRYSISLPQSYCNSKYTPASYPVLYVLDGETAFEYVSTIVRFLSKGVYAHVPEMIVVGVNNTNRTRDLTPSRSSRRSPADTAKVLFEGSGGGDAFTNFLSGELIPQIERSYRANGFRILMGHSFGGLAATNILLHYPGIFNAFLIHDPSYWWDNGYMLKKALSILADTDFKKQRVYLSQADNEDKGGFDDHFESIKTLYKMADSIANPSLHFRYKFYQQEDHGTIPLPATFDGLKSVFEGYWVDFKRISGDHNLLEEHYAVFSRQMGYQFKPAEAKLDFIVKYFKDNNKKIEAAAILKQYRQLYPQTAPASL